MKKYLILCHRLEICTQIIYYKEAFFKEDFPRVSFEIVGSKTRDLGTVAHFQHPPKSIRKFINLVGGVFSFSNKFYRVYQLIPTPGEATCIPTCTSSASMKTRKKGIFFGTTCRRVTRYGYQKWLK